MAKKFHFRESISFRQTFLFFAKKLFFHQTLPSFGDQNRLYLKFQPSFFFIFHQKFLFLQKFKIISDFWSIFLFYTKICNTWSEIRFSRNFRFCWSKFRFLLKYHFFDEKFRIFDRNLFFEKMYFFNFGLVPPIWVANQIVGLDRSELQLKEQIKQNRPKIQVWQKIQFWQNHQSHNLLIEIRPFVQLQEPIQWLRSIKITV